MAADALAWATVLGLGAILKAAIDAIIAGVKEARAARREPLDELERTRRSRLLWIETAMNARTKAIACGVDDLDDLPDDPLITK